MERRRFLSGSAVAAFGAAFGSVPLELLSPFSPAQAARGASGQPKPPTARTIAENQKYLLLPFDDHTDFDDARRGFMGGLPDGVIVHDGKVVFDAKKFHVPLEEPAPDTMNPSLWRICKLNGLSGLFKVCDGLYQVRNIDVANLTIMEGKTGLIIIDCTTSAIAANAALELYYQHCQKPGEPRKPVVAVILTHSHVDHFGGIGGVTTAEDVASEKCRVIAPQGFTEEAVSENLYAGNAMFRRATYMYGSYMPVGPGPAHAMGSGLGVYGVSESPTLITPKNPDDWVTETGQTKEIDGIDFEFLLAPGSEAPSEMHFYTPSLKALCTAENAVHTLHNFYTLRGAKTRDTARWVKYLNQTLDMWGGKAEILYAPHHWPICGKDEIVAHIENYRDAFKYIHDRSMHLANNGYTMPQLGDMVKLPPTLAKNWATRGYYGTVSHDARAVYNFYLGYFSANPAELNPLPPPEAAPRYVEMMGGADAILASARKFYDAGEYRWVAQVLEHLVYAQPGNQEARDLQADAFEQLGYQAEAATWRNFYFVGAYELRNGIPDAPAGVTDSSYLVPNITLELSCQFFGIMLDTDKAAGSVIKINFEVDGGEKRSLVLKNSVTNSREVLVDDPDVTLRGSAPDINAVLLSSDPKVAQALLDSGKLKAVGNVDALFNLLGMTSKFEFWFPIVTPNRA
jgi:alkyl sulfatase BDS1-like metallo-beta-lactamase superfamily hydrolase